MASTASISQFNVGTVGASGTAHKSVQEDFERLPGNDAPTVAMIGYGPAVAVDEGFKIQKIVDRDLPTTVTNTANIVTAATDITLSTTDAASLQIGQILMIDEELVRVTTVASSTTVGITKGFAGTTSTTHTTSSTVHILSPLFLDTDTFVESAKYRGELKSFYPGQIMYSWSESAMRTAVRSYLTKGEDEMTFEKRNKMREAVRQLEKLVWYGKAQAPTSSNHGSFDGLYRLIDTNKNTSVGVLTATHLVDLAEDIMAWDNSITSFDVCMNRNMKRIWDAVLNAYFDRRGEPTTTKLGTRVDVFETSIATFRVTIIPELRDGEMYFLKKSDVKLHPLAVRGGFAPGWQEVDRGPSQTNALTRQKAYYNILTLLIGDERRHGRLAGITTTSSSYAGYV